MMIKGIRFAEVPPVGTTIWLKGNQEYRLVGSEPYVRRDGQTSAVLTWATVDPETGEPFGVTTGLTFREFPARRAPGNRSQARVRLVKFPAVGQPRDSGTG